MTAFQPVARTADLAPGQRSVVEIEDHEILLTNVEGTIYATDNVCTCIAAAVGHSFEKDEVDPHTHAGRLSRLQRGPLEGARVTCPDHGSTYDLKTGRVVSGCAEIALNTFEVREADGALEVALMADSERHFWHDEGETTRP